MSYRGDENENKWEIVLDKANAFYHIYPSGRLKKETAVTAEEIISTFKFIK